MDFNDINRNLIIAEEEIKCLKAGKKVSATRGRKALLDVKKQSDLLRKQILEYSRSDQLKKNKVPVTKKAKVVPVEEVPVVSNESTNSETLAPPEEKKTKPKSKKKPVV